MEDKTRTTIYMPDHMRRSLKMIAARKDTSISALVTDLCRRFIEEEEEKIAEPTQ